jgi:HEAT repeat protein
MKRWAILASLVVLVPAVTAGFAGDDDPKLKGKPLSHWLKKLEDKNRGFQMRAARVIENAPEELRPKIVPKLIELLKSKRENTKFPAAQALGKYGPVAKDAVPHLLPMLEGTQYERNRTSAAVSLGQILKDSKSSEQIDKVVAALIKGMKDQYSDVRRECARACGMIGPAAKAFLPGVVPLLQEHKPGVDKYEGYPVRLAAAWAVGRMGPHATVHIDRMIAMLHVDGRVNQYVSEAIGRIGAVHENVVPNMVDWLEKMGRDWRGNRETRMNAWVALEKFGEKSLPAVPLIARYLREAMGNSETPELYTQWFRILKAIGPKAKEALPEVKKWAAAKSVPRGWDKAKFEEMKKTAAEAAAVLEGKAKAE